MGTVSVPVVSLITAAAAAGTAAYSSYSAGQAQSAQASYQAKVAANNQSIAQQNAQTALAVGESQAEQSEMNTRARGATINAAQGANNITIGKGSAGQVEQSSRELGMLDSSTIISNAARQAYGFETQGSNFGAESQLESSEAGQALTAGDFGAAGSLLGGASSVSKQYVGYRQSGAIGPNATF